MKKIKSIPGETSTVVVLKIICFVSHVIGSFLPVLFKQKHMRDL